MLLFWINVHLSQNWHLFYLIKPTTKEWPLSTQACQTLDSHTFLKGWEISSLGQTLASASADPLTFSSTFLLMSSNLYHIQDNALGMPTDLSALLMAAFCFSQVNRRKFRSQTSDNMDRWKAEMERVREKRKMRREKSRRERVRRKKMQMREKVGKSPNTVFFPTCQVRVVRFYVSCLLLPPPASCLVLLLLLLLSSSPPRPPCHPCRPRRPRPTATRDPQCSLPDLNHDHPRPVFPAGPQPRPSTPSVPCRTSTASIPAQCSLPDLNREYPRQVFPAGPHVGRYGTKNVQKKVRKNVRKNVRRYARRYAR